MSLFKGKLFGKNSLFRSLFDPTVYLKNAYNMVKNDPFKAAMVAAGTYLTAGAAGAAFGGTGAATVGGASAAGTGAAAAGSTAASTAAAGSTAAASTAASTAAIAKTAALAAGTYATYDSGVKQMRMEETAAKQEKASKTGEAIAEADYQKKVSEANERAYQANRASLLSARRQYTRNVGGATAGRVGGATNETEQYRLG